MSEQTPHEQPNIFPGFRYRQAQDVMSWLERAFGFEQHFVVAGPGDSIAHAQLKLGPGLIMLGSAVTDPDPQNPWDQAKCGVYVYVADIDAHYERARAAGAEIVRELEDTDYGSREYSARDPEGNLWSFGTYQPLAEQG